MNHLLPRQTLSQLMKPTMSAGLESILNTPLSMPVEMSLAMHLLTQAVQPSPTNPFLEKFIHDVFNDECLVNAYFFPKYLSRDSRTIISVSGVSSLELRLASAVQTKSKSEPVVEAIEGLHCLPYG